MNKIRIGIVGYGNLGKGVLKSLKLNEDMELVAIFTRRNIIDIAPVEKGIIIDNVDNINSYIDKIDVMILCGGSAKDLPVQTPKIASYFNTVDSFDTHALIESYYNTLEDIAKKSKKVNIISIGWDPGLFSLIRSINMAILPNGHESTFWGKGISQGHSDAIRKVKGVKNAVEYTIPMEDAINSSRMGNINNVTKENSHLRECFVVLDGTREGSLVEKEIRAIPNYFDKYETTVHFITEEELEKNHNKINHGGYVFRTGYTGNIDNPNKHTIEYSLKLDSNPEFTASVLVAYARAAHRLYIERNYGVKTIFDIPISYIISESTKNNLLNEIL